MNSEVQMAVPLSAHNRYSKCKASFSTTAYSLLIHIVSLQEQLGRDVELFILESGGNLSQNHTRVANVRY